MIGLAELPFIFAKNDFFEEYVQNNLQPQFRKISSNTVKNDAIRLWQSKKENIKNYFANIPARIVYSYRYMVI